MTPHYFVEVYRYIFFKTVKKSLNLVHCSSNWSGSETWFVYEFFLSEELQKSADITLYFNRRRGGLRAGARVKQPLLTRVHLGGKTVNGLA